MLPLTPTHLGRYEIVDEIGKGAMGVVYLARDPLIGRLVALKTFRVGFSIKDQDLEQFRVRFIREAQSAGILSHPNIVTIHDVVEHGEEGIAFIAMEYIRGTNLKAMLQGGEPLAPSFVVEAVSQVAEALDYAHQHRVIHRDVKPANILITDDGRVKLTDFGIARLDTSNLTQEGQLLGTPNYMAPEQVQGREVDHRADIFSLGVVLYEMLTRHKPFQGENLTVVSHRIVYEEFTPPRDHTRDLPPGIEQVLSRALEKDPARRFQTARALAEEVRRVILGVSGGEDLNETQSLSSTMVAPPSSAPAPAGGSGTGSGSGSRPHFLGPAAPAAPSASGAPAAAARAGRRVPSWKRLLVLVVLAALVPLLAGAAALEWLARTVPAESGPAAGEDRGREVVELLKGGHRKLRAGDFAGGLADYRRAEELDPQRVGPVLRSAERRYQELGEQVRGEFDLSLQMIDARAALAAGRYAEAERIASEVLAVDFVNAEAAGILTRAREARARQANRPPPPAVREDAGRRTQREEQVAQVAEEPPPGPSEASAPRQQRLSIDFTAQGEGTIQVFVDNAQVMNERYAFVDRKWFSKIPFLGRVADSVPVPAGVRDLRVHVAPRGRRAEVVNLSGNFPAGETRVLEVRLLDSGRVTANLN